MKGVEHIQHKNRLLGIVLRSCARVKKSTFFSPDTVAMQIGIISHRRGYREAPHTHKKVKRVITDVEQFLLVKRGTCSIDFYDRRKKVRTIFLKKGDAILIIQGGHALNAFSNCEAFTIKQGPFLGPAFDKEEAIRQ